MPFFAPMPLPTMIATGVANPSAQGQEITSTEIPLASAKEKLCPAKSQPIAVIRAITMTAGTNTPLTLSAMRAIGAFVAAASLTMRMICESVVSSPTRVASQRIYPLSLIVAALTVSPTVLSTGMLSPVRADSLTEVAPSLITPSTGILSPSRTAKRSPFATSSMPTSTSAPSRITTAVFGASFISPLSASVVRPLDIASSIFPTVISAGIIAALSK